MKTKNNLKKLKEIVTYELKRTYIVILCPQNSDKNLDQIDK